MDNRVIRGMGAVLIGVLPSLALGGEAYPLRPIRMIVGSTAGSAPDILARIVGQRLSVDLGQQVVVDNRAGAAGTLGAKLTADATPDGYTIGMVSAAFATTTATYQLQYDVRRDFAVIAGIAAVPLVLVTAPAFGAGSLNELIVLVKGNPGKINYASPGSGGIQHLVTEAFAQAIGARMVHVPYKSGALAVNAVLSGETQLFFAGMPPALPFVKQGKLRALAVTTKVRSQSAPEVPTMEEAGLKGFEADNWHGLLAPAKTPAALIARLNEVLARALQEAEVKARFLAAGGEAIWTSPAAFQRLIDTEVERWGKLVRTLGVKIP
jgi:tripartite-type tricarboxylate transporter receptor subunit TctC